MEFEKNKGSKRQSLSHQRDEKEIEERMDKFYTLLVKIKDMKGLRRHGSENNKRVKPVLEAVWQPTFSLEDFDRVEGEEKGKGKGKGKAKETMNMEKVPVMEHQNVQERRNGMA